MQDVACLFQLVLQWKFGSSSSLLRSRSDPCLWRTGGPVHRYTAKSLIEDKVTLWTNVLQPPVMLYSIAWRHSARTPSHRLPSTTIEIVDLESCINKTKAPDDIVTTMTSLNTTERACGATVTEFVEGVYMVSQQIHQRRHNENSPGPSLILHIIIVLSSFSTACLTKVRTWLKAYIRCDACHMKIGGGLATVVHSCGHLCGEFGAVNIELQDLRRLRSIFQLPCLKFDESFSSCVLGDPSFTSFWFNQTQCLSQEALLLLCIIMKLYWQVREANLASQGQGDQESTAHCAGPHEVSNVKRWIRMPPTLNAQANWLQNPISQTVTLLPLPGCWQVLPLLRTP